MTDTKPLVVAALLRFTKEDAFFSEVPLTAGDYHAKDALCAAIDSGAILLVSREDLEWVRKWVLHGEVEQPCPKCGIPMPVNPDCGWLCANLDCAWPDIVPFGIEPWRILDRILNPTKENQP